MKMLSILVATILVAYCRKKVHFSNVLLPIYLVALEVFIAAAGSGDDGYIFGE